LNSYEKTIVCWIVGEVQAAIASTSFAVWNAVMEPHAHTSCGDSAAPAVAPLVLLAAPSCQTYQ
jgi:hypothetical protein